MTEKEKNIDKVNSSSDEIDLIALAKTIWDGRRIIIKTLIIFTFLGLFVALFSKKEYTATTTMVPQVNNPSSNMGGLSSLASLAGFNMNMNSGSYDISPVLYPQIVSSIEFQLEIMSNEYEFEEVENPVSLYDYYMDYYKLGLFAVMKKYSIGLPGVILTALRGEQEETESGQRSGLIKLTKDQDKIRKIIEDHLNLSVNDKDGYLTLNARFHQAYLSAQIAQIAQKLLQEYVTKFKIEKALAQLEFITERYDEKKEEFEDAQSKLAAYRDANKNIISALVRTQEERLQNEYQLAFDVYSELAQQLEQSLIQVKEDTPVFSVIEEVSVPIEKSKPNRLIILFIWIFLGGIFGVGIVFSQTFL